MAVYPLGARVASKKADLLTAVQDQDLLVWRRRFHARPTGGDWPVAATTANVDIVFPEGMIIEGGFIALITAFSGGAVSAATLSIGTTASPATYLAATNVFTGAASSGAVTVAAGAGLGSFLSANATPAALGTIRFQLITTTANANALTAGAVDVYLRLRPYSVKTT